jgi:hypothetical protein
VFIFKATAPAYTHTAQNGSRLEIFYLFADTSIVHFYLMMILLFLIIPPRGLLAFFCARLKFEYNSETHKTFFSALRAFNAFSIEFFVWIRENE